MKLARRPFPPGPGRPGLRRGLLGAGLAALLLGATPARALRALAPDSPPADEAFRLDGAESRALRAWVVRIADEQVRQGPSPRWTHRDCAGLVRFAVAEALAEHDARWRRAMGIAGRVPPELSDAARERLRHQWRRPDGSVGAYASALAMVQENTRLVGRDPRLAQPADLLFFDQGHDQHLMLWTGRGIVYHTGAEPRPDDTGLRATSLRALLQWPDTRWRPNADNPNFAGVFQLAFLK